MLYYNIQDRGKLPIYRFIYKSIKEEINSGVIKAGEKLPSKRELAQKNGISIVTVMNAYDMLLSEGYIYSKPQKGYYVIPIKAQKLVEQPDIIMEEEKEHNLFFDFSVHSVSGKQFPFATWSRLIRKVILDYDSELLNPLPHKGVKVLREAIADYLRHFKGMKVSPQQIIIGAGTEYMYTLIIKLLGDSKVYGIENPGYNKIKEIYEMNGVKNRLIDIDSKGMNVDSLHKSGANVAHLSPSHHYPTGVVMTADRRHKVLNWADETDGYIIEDDYDSEFGNTRYIDTLFSTDKNERVIYLNTFSRTIAPSIRISYVVLPPSLIKRYNENMSFLSCTVSGFEQYTLSAFIGDGYFERHLNRMQKFYQDVKKEVQKILNESEIKDKINIIENMSGLHFLVKINTKKSDKELIYDLKKKGIGARFLSQYDHNNNGTEQHFMIVNYSGMNTEKLKKATKILATLI